MPKCFMLIVNQFASEISEDVLKDVALDEIEREVNGGYLQYLEKKRSKR